ncbi:hypothetical protein [Allorhizocola rhizosphaerae]|uniref:hypothetical protein n=1 Tax=Allorhizocola rhizosphaerae TaxID=1872709 RepID=UPI001B8D6CCC|nr:hypothetical protein [Allorhizocola rhizosphaerae]
MAQVWQEFAGTLRGPTEAATGHAQTVWQVNVSENVAAFEKAWQSQKGPVNNLNDAATVVELVGAGLMVCAGIILALKIAVIAQLVILAIQIAQAIATAAVTFGASLLEIPIFRSITKRILEALLDQAINKVLGG